MPELDLTGARQLAEGYLGDQCRIELDAEGVYDDVLDINTGALAVQPLVPVVLYEGLCRFSPTGVGQTIEGAQVTERRGYRARLPWSAPEIPRGARLVITVSADPRLVGKQLRVVEGAQGGSYRVLTTLVLEEIDQVAPA